MFIELQPLVRTQPVILDLHHVEQVDQQSPDTVQITLSNGDSILTRNDLGEIKDLIQQATGNPIGAALPKPPRKPAATL